MATATDDFNRADDPESLGANWTIAKGMVSATTYNNGVGPYNSGGALSGSYYSATAFGADQFSEATLPVLTSGGDSNQAVMVRMITTGSVKSGYAAGHSIVDMGNALLRIWKWVGGTPTYLAAHGSESVTAGTVLRLEVSGTTLTLFVGGVQKLQVTDASLSSGQPGLCLAGQSVTIVNFDNWSGGDLGAAPDPFIPSTRARLYAPILAQ